MALGKDWPGFGPEARRGVIIGSMVILALTLALGYWVFFEKRYVPLFSGMDPREVSAVVAQLEHAKADYRLSDNETEVLVPESAVHSLRVKMFSTGVPQTGGSGFELFDNSKFGLTEFEKKINYQRALQGELTRTIESLEEVRRARVHLVLPESGLFRKADTRPTASVTIFAKEGYRLSPGQIEGIQRLVAAAVPNLDPSHVSIADEQGKILTWNVDEVNETGLIGGALGTKQSMERYLADKAMRVLEHAFGPHQAIVSVDVTLDLKQVQETVEDVISPAGGENRGVVRRRQSHSGGVADGPQTGRNRSEPQYGTNTSEVEYKLGRKVEQTTGLPGRILRMSVAVIVPPEQARYDNIGQLVAMAVGLNSARGDSIVVQTGGPTLPRAGAVGARPGASAPTLASERPDPSPPLLSGPLVKPLEDFSPTRFLEERGFDILAGGSALLLVTLFALALARRIRRPARPERQGRLMSPTDRENLALEVRKWLDEP
jgi:flagellar M-ring protein FliF